MNDFPFDMDLPDRPENSSGVIFSMKASELVMCSKMVELDRDVLRLMVLQVEITIRGSCRSLTKTWLALFVISDKAIALKFKEVS
jgi:hypothetical protein